MRWQLVDRLLNFSAWGHLVALKLGTFEEQNLMARFGGPPRVPALLVLESAFQAARWLAEGSSDFELTFSPGEARPFEADRLGGFGPGNGPDGGPLRPDLGLAPSEGVVWLLRVERRQKDRVDILAFSRLLAPGDSPGELDLRIREYHLPNPDQDRVPPTADEAEAAPPPPALVIRKSRALYFPMLLTGSLVPLADLDVPARRRTLWNELSGQPPGPGRETS